MEEKIPRIKLHHGSRGIWKENAGLHSRHQIQDIDIIIYRSVIDINIIYEPIFKIIAFQKRIRFQQFNGIRGQGVFGRKKPALQSQRRIQGKNKIIYLTIIIP
jgi:hypothetical protein